MEEQVYLAAKLLLAYRGVVSPTHEQVAGAVIEAQHYNDIAALRAAWER